MSTVQIPVAEAARMARELPDEELARMYWKRMAGGPVQELEIVINELVNGGWTLFELGNIVLRSTSTLTRFRRGEATITADQAIRMLAVLAPLRSAGTRSGGA